MGMKTNLVDREIYNLPQGVSADDLKNQMSEKLKFVLSNKDIYDPLEDQKKARLAKKIIIPSRYTQHDKINRYGGKIEDPFKINTHKRGDFEERVFTSKDHREDLGKRLQGIKLINESFIKVKDIKVGMEKPDSHGRLRAAKVFDIVPSFSAMPQQILHVLNEDMAEVESNLPIVSKHPRNSQDPSESEKMKLLKKSYHTNNG